MRFLRRWVAWVKTSDAAAAHSLRAARDALLGEMPVLAAGTALFAILATVPALAAVVGMYGLVADPHAIHGHLRGLTTLDVLTPKKNQPGNHFPGWPAILDGQTHHSTAPNRR